MYSKAYLWFLNIFLFSVLGGMAYFIWRLAEGFEWYYRIAWVVGLFAAGALLAWLSSHGFGAIPVRIINLPKQDK